MENLIKKFHEQYYSNYDYKEIKEVIQSFFRMAHFLISEKLEPVNIKHFATLKPSKARIFKKYNMLKYKICDRRKATKEKCLKNLKQYEQFLYKR